ncbi:MAG: c-type cytochrome [Gallionella sp.]
MKHIDCRFADDCRLRSASISQICGIIKRAFKRYLSLETVLLVVIAISLFVSVSKAARAAEVSPGEEIELGRRIYVEGKLPSGAELTGMRFGTTPVSGEAAACVNCHRPSGMGAVEGDDAVQPITGNYLFGSADEKHLAVMDPRVSKRFNKAHDAYTEESLANAIVHGANNAGRKMSDLMPRYAMTPSDMRVLTVYLKQLSKDWSPGVTDDNINFGMVITPDADPARRDILIKMMRIAFNQKNGSTMTSKRSGTKRQHMVSAAEMVLGTERTWDLSVWELHGAPQTWAEQMETYYRQRPVFALVSGLSNSTWQPVHDFCEREKVPCWFPSVDLPVQSRGTYSFYFSRGVALEADVLASYLKNKGESSHLVQIFRDDGVGQGASGALKHALEGSVITIEDRAISGDQAVSDSLKKTIATIKDGDVVMMWLRPNDIAALNTVSPVTGAKYYFSAVLGQAENAPLSPAWKEKSNLVYPYELPEKRAVNLAYFHAWLNMRKLPLVDEVMQSEAFFTLNFLTDTVSEMLNNMYRDYLMERAETMLSKREGSKAEQEARGRLFLGRTGDMERKYGQRTAPPETRVKIQPHAGSAVKSEGTTIYPRLSLGPGQRFASKGGYIVRFANPEDVKLIVESEWIVP